MLYTGLLHFYAEIPIEMAETLLREEAKSNEEFREQRRQKRNTSDSEGIQKRGNNNAGIRNSRVLPQVRAWNYFAPLRTQMEFEGSKESTNNANVSEQQQEPPSQAGRLL
jgi:hypothetical protein